MAPLRILTLLIRSFFRLILAALDERKLAAEYEVLLLPIQRGLLLARAPNGQTDRLPITTDFQK